MKTNKLFFFLVLLSIIYSQIIEIENGKTIEIILEDKTEKKVTYNFIVPESDIYEEGILIYKLDFNNSIYLRIYEDGERKKFGIHDNNFYSYQLSSIKNKTITFEFSKYIFEACGQFTLLDLTKEINTTLDNLLNIVPTSSLEFSFDPLCKINYKIDLI